MLKGVAKERASVQSVVSSPDGLTLVSRVARPFAQQETIDPSLVPRPHPNSGRHLTYKLNAVSHHR